MSGHYPLKAIDTSYAGYQFRSRLEARWAVFFDSLGFRWEYEPEGFVLADGTRYLPDFRVWTPQGNPIWYEIKPKHVQQDGKLAMFKEGLEKAYNESDYKDPAPRASLLCGDPIDVLGDKGIHICPRCGFITQSISVALFGGSCEMGVLCHPCDWETPSRGDPEAGLLGFVSTPWKGWLEIEKISDYLKVMRQIFEAASVARRARFEHGASLPLPDIADVLRLVSKQIPSN